MSADAREISSSPAAASTPPQLPCLIPIAAESAQPSHAAAAVAQPLASFRQSSQQQNVSLNLPIEGLDSIKSAVLRATINQAALEILNCEPRNDRISPSVVEADGSVCMRVRGLTTIVAKQLEHRQWSLTSTEADCVRSVQYDAKSELLCVMLSDASRVPSVTSVASAAAAVDGDADACSDTDSSDNGAGRASCALADNRPFRPAAVMRIPASGARKQKRQREPRKPFFTISVSMNGAEAAATGGECGSRAVDSQAMSPHQSAEPSGLALIPRRQLDSGLELRKAHMPAVARAIASLAAAVSLQSEVVSARGEMFESRRLQHCFCTVNVCGIVVFDWRLLNAAAWPAGFIPSSIRSSFLIHFDVGTKELVVRISPPDQVERIYKALTRRSSGSTLLVDDDDDEEEGVTTSRKRKRDSSLSISNDAKRAKR